MITYTVRLVKYIIPTQRKSPYFTPLRGLHYSREASNSAGFQPLQVMMGCQRPRSPTTITGPWVGHTADLHRL